MAKTKNTKLINPNRRNAVIYARYSSSSQTEQSIEAQIRIANEFALRNRYNLINTYIDRAMTGTNDDRPGFRQMIDDSNLQEFDYVIVYKLDRFSRNRYDSATYKKKLKDNNVKVISATETINETPDGILFESMIEGYNEYYSAELSEKVKRGLKQAHIDGFFTGSHIPLGYTLNNRKLEINEEEAKIIKYIFNQCASGKMLSEIANELNEKGIKDKNGSKFYNSKMSKILDRNFYTGVYTYPDGTYDNIFPQIISPSLFEQCKQKNASNCRRPKHFKSNYILSGKLFCMECGSPLTAYAGTSRHNKVYQYYACNEARKPNSSCNKKKMNKDFLEELVIDKIKQYVLEPDNLYWLAKDMTRFFEEKAKDNNEIIIIEKELKKINKELDNLVDAVMSGLKSQRIQDEIVKKESSIKELNEKLILAKLSTNNKISEKECLDFLFSLTKLDLNLVDNQKLLINRFVKKIEVGDKIIKILFYPISRKGIINEKNDETKKENVGSNTKPITPPSFFSK